MDTTLLGQFKEIGIALAAVVAFAYITKYVIDKNKDIFDRLTSQMEETQKNYSAFVLENNHSSTERIEKSTEAIVKVGNVVEAHTKVLERLADRIDLMNSK